ncbi:mechanosensitive ion channel family protein [bacterium]|nr:mechanosensitive ion channel family protein [bacterium]
MLGTISPSTLATLPRAIDRLDEAALTWATTRGIGILVTIGLAFVALRLGTALIDRIQGALQDSSRADQSPRRAQRSLTLTTILRSTLRAVVLFATTLSVLAAVGINITPILASAGVVGLAVGFGAQSLVKDVISGFFILFEDQYGVGDVVDIDGKSGLVERMNLRITQLRNTAGELITIPNGSIKIVSNRSKEWARAVLELGVAYDADVDHALSLMMEEGRKLWEERPNDVLALPEIAGIQAFEENSIRLRVLMKTAPLQQWSIASEWRRRTKYAFDREAIKSRSGL